MPTQLIINKINHTIVELQQQNLFKKNKKMIYLDEKNFYFASSKLIKNINELSENDKIILFNLTESILKSLSQSNVYIQKIHMTWCVAERNENIQHHVSISLFFYNKYSLKIINKKVKNQTIFMITYNNQARKTHLFIQNHKISKISQNAKLIKLCTSAIYIDRQKNSHYE